MYCIEDIIGSSSKMHEVKSLARIYAKTDATILLMGESGTGKEMLAQAIHNLSNRSSGSFIAVNSGALTESLVESELFGYAGGTFTGGRRDGKAGLFEEADGGTLFLDEIGDMPLQLQNHLLRVLQEKTVRRLGSADSIPVDVRVIAATNRDLEKAVQNGSFRQDLYYRLEVLPIHIPPLRERGDDIAAIAKVLLKKYDQKYHKNHYLSADVLAHLKTLPWPGNIRQLENLMERLALVVAHEDVRITDVEAFIPAKREKQCSHKVHDVKEHIYMMIEQMHEEGRSITQISQELGISRATVYRLRQRYGGRQQ